MSNQWKYIVGILFLFFLSCNRAGEHEALFRQVESVVSDHPDSAMVLLQRIEEPERLDSADWACWALLTIQARDKAFIRHTTDSVINRVADYYQRFGDNHQKALAYYYVGRVNSDLGQLERATDAYLRASDYSAKTDDHDLTFRILTQVGTIFAKQKSLFEAFEFYQKALAIAQEANDSVNMAFGNAYLGRIYGSNEDWSQANAHYQKAIEIAKRIGDVFALKLATQELAAIYRRQNRLDEAYNMLKSLVSQTQELGNRSLYLVVGNTYQRMGQLDSADYYIRYAVGSYDIHVRRSAYQALYNLYKQMNQYEKATNFNELFIACQDSIASMGTMELSMINDGYNKRIREQTTWNKIFCFVGSTVIVLLLLGGLFYWHSRRRWREELERKKEEMEMLEQIEREIVRQLELEQQTHKAVREEADRNLELVLAQENQLKDLHAQKHVLEQEIETLNKKLGEAGIFSALRQIEQQSLFERKMFAFLAEMKVNPRSLLKDEIKDLDLFIGQKYAKERKAHPGMTVTDWRYWLLTRMEFSNENMATLMNVRIDSVYKQKQRVKEHLNQKNKPTSKS